MCVCILVRAIFGPLWGAVRACVLVSVWVYTCILCFLYFVRTFVSALACELCGSFLCLRAWHANFACHFLVLVNCFTISPACATYVLNFRTVP